eukprot:1198670-Rhodomonas_salina.4
MPATEGFRKPSQRTLYSSGEDRQVDVGGNVPCTAPGISVVVAFNSRVSMETSSVFRADALERSGLS